MNYKDLIDRLRNNPEIDIEDVEQAADVIESLTAQLAAGPVAWLHEDTLGSWVQIGSETSVMRAKSTPLYAIPIPTEE